MAFKQKFMETRAFDEKRAKKKYVCATGDCGAQCFSNHAELKATREVTEELEGLEVHGFGLGSWNCLVHGSTKVRVVMERR